MQSMQMKNFTKDIKQNIETEIKRIELNDIDIFEKIKSAIDFIQISIKQLKSFTADYQFEDQQEEILFFKKWKPQITSLLLYYVRLHDIEKKRAGKSRLAQCRYLKKESEIITAKLQSEFCQYYLSGKTHSDKRFFLRNSYDILLDTDCLSFEKDHSFSTLHDYSVADTLANQLLYDYITTETEHLSGQLYCQLISSIENKELQWTDSKVALAELVYALYSGGCLNNGNTNLKDIAFCFETLFNIEIGDFYRIFLEIRGRKKNRTQFLDKLKETLIKMMDDQDKK